jgi:hypothetical protein
MITAKEVRDAIAASKERDLAERSETEARAKAARQELVDLARENILPQLLGEIEAQINSAIRAQWTYVRISPRPMMRLDLLKDDLTRTLNGLGYGVSYENDTDSSEQTVIDIRWDR